MLRRSFLKSIAALIALPAIVPKQATPTGSWCESDSTRTILDDFNSEAWNKHLYGYVMSPRPLIAHRFHYEQLKKMGFTDNIICPDPLMEEL